MFSNLREGGGEKGIIIKRVCTGCNLYNVREHVLHGIFIQNLYKLTYNSQLSFLLKKKKKKNYTKVHPENKWQHQKLFSQRLKLHRLSI